MWSTGAHSPCPPSLPAQAWSISAVEAFISTLLPTYGAPPAPDADVLRAAAERYAVTPPPPRLAPADDRGAHAAGYLV